MKSRKILWILILTLLIPFIKIIPSHNVWAAVPDSNEVYNNAPHGMKLDGYIDVPAGYSNTSTGKSNDVVNSAQMVDGYSTDIVRILSETSSTKNQISSFWGKIKTGTDGSKTFNYFDLSKPQEVSAWIYNGDSDTDRPDGFAFVLQNDSLGTDAISRYNGKPQGGETLGVWGASTTDTGTAITSADVTGNAISKSFAIEFDSQLNKNIPTKSSSPADAFDMTGKTSSYEGNFKYPHISWQYPDSTDTYSAHNFSKTYYYQEFKHPEQSIMHPYLNGYDGEDDRFNGVIGTYNPASAWRHFAMEYTPPEKGSTTATIVFRFNDKYPDGTAKSINAFDSRKVNIDINHFKSTDNKIRWGFTAANGSPNSSKKDVSIVMEKMPAIVDLKIDSILYDLTNNTNSTEMTSTTNGDGVTTYAALPTNDGDNLKLKYSLKYVDGIDTSGKITANLALPEHVDYKADSDGNIGLIKYYDMNGKVTKEEKISQSQLEKITVTIPGTTPTYKKIDGLNLTLDELKDINSYITIEVNGDAQAPESDTLQTTKVSSEHTSYKSDHYNGDVMSPAFTISNERLQIKNSNSLNQTLTVDDTLKLAGTASYLKGSTFDGGNVQANIKVFDADGKAIGEAGKADIAIASGAKTGNFNIDYPLADLDSGKTYSFQINLTDANKRVSNTLTYTVQVEDNKELQLSKTNYLSDMVIEKDNFAELLKTKVVYSDNSIVGKTKLTTYYQADDQAPVTVDSDGGNTSNNLTLSYDLSKLNLSIGTHTIKVYTSDGKRDSNTLTYQIKVIDKGLVLTAKEPVINVRDNDPVPLTWNVVYSSDVDGKTSADKVKPLKYLLQVKNEGDTEYRDFYYQGTSTEEDIKTPSQLDDDHNFTFEVNPIKYTANGVNTELNVLKEGQNQIKFSVYEGNYRSNEVNVTVNVPKLTTKLTAVKSDIYFKGTGSMVYYPFEYQYLEDDEYTSRTGQQKTTFVLENGREIGMGIRPDSDNFRSFSLQGAIMVLSLDWKTNPDHVITAYTTDPYDRKTNTVTFTLHMIDKFLELHVDPSERFNDIAYDQAADTLVGRQTLWNVSVENVGAKWNLYAQCEGLHNLQNGQYMKGLVFVDKNDNALDLNEERMIASRATKIGTGQPKMENVADNWDDDDGILLRNNKPDMAGEYQGTVHWTLEDVIN